ncbi:hypothetical protein BQ8794_100060 [Mesorhizobium prunaredense]|uniref:Uncharacterized protein n=1 Tax=Mesorhizobium prunaredense TaxID=1631249 RepID=A0A1R3UZU4_9HYPH|nr:hypothetical protein BQ8794_100060 [Mesorhizobium prunaredense]
MEAAPTVRRGSWIAGAACAIPGLGFDRAVLFWDSAVNDSLKLELIKRMLIEIAVLRVTACI